MRYVLVIAFVGLALVSFFLFSQSRKQNSTNSSSPKTENLTIKGSDTEVQMVSNLSENFVSQYPSADISVTGGGSSVGITALINQEVEIANSSRKMKDQEYEQAKAKGLDIQEFIVARDGLSIIVNPSNPLTSLTIDQLGRIYRGEIDNWKELGGSDNLITLYGRQSTSGTYTFFRELVLKADYSTKMREMEGNQAIVDAIKSDKNSIGYVGVGYVRNEQGQQRDDIRIVKIAVDAQSTPVSPLDKEAVLQKKYPIFRPIYQYLQKVPAKNSLLYAFLDFEMSEKGSQIIEQSGFYPIISEDVSTNQKLLQKDL